MGNRKELHQCNKGYLKKKKKKNLVASYILHDETQNAFSQRLGKRQGCPLQPFLFSTLLEILICAIKQEKEFKSVHIRKM